MKLRFVLGALISIISCTISLTPAQAAQCLSNFPDSAWQQSEPIDIPLNSDLLRTGYLQEFTNIHGDNYKLGSLTTSTGSFQKIPSESNSLDILIGNLSINFHLLPSSKEKVTYVYRGANCEPRTIVVNREISLKRLNVKVIDLNDNQAIIDNFFGPSTFSSYLKSSTFLTKDLPIEAFKAFVTDVQKYNLNPVVVTDQVGATDGDAFAAQWIYHEFASRNIDMRWGLITGQWPIVSSSDGCIATKWNGARYFSNLSGQFEFPKNDSLCSVDVFMPTNDGGVVKIGNFRVLNQTSAYLNKSGRPSSSKSVGKITSITCTNGKLKRIVTSLNPTCPKGFH
jgi:hypothetical protein